MIFYPEVMSERQARILGDLGGDLAGRGFYLAGGTAVALHLGHRISVDLDWFTGQSFDPLTLLGHLKATGLGPADVTTDEGTLHATMDGVRTTFLEYRYPLVREAIPWSETGCLIASLPDLGAAKLSAIAGRGARRDFVDLHAILAAGVPLGDLLEAYARKFDVPESGHLLRSLIYFDNAEEEAMPTMLKEIVWVDIRTDLERRVRQFVEEA
jgi:hypothetical protein